MGKKKKTSAKSTEKKAGGRQSSVKGGRKPARARKPGNKTVHQAKPAERSIKERVEEFDRKLAEFERKYGQKADSFRMFVIALGLLRGRPIEDWEGIKYPPASETYAYTHARIRRVCHWDEGTPERFVRDVDEAIERDRSQAEAGSSKAGGRGEAT